jgi:YD repeat-containing protein
LRSFLTLAAASAVAIPLAVLVGGSASSGALWLLLPRGGVAKTSHPLPGDYEPLHKGHAVLSSGLYIRENEDLVVNGTPALILRRVHISDFRVSKQFGIGAMHNGERYLRGDGRTFQWVELIRPGEFHVRFERTSPGTLLWNAMFEHRATIGEWAGARLGWTGWDWALKKRDGSLLRFQPCGPGTRYEACSIVYERDADGHVIEYRRTRTGRLSRIEADDHRWIAFDYDGADRIVRASDQAGRSVAYEYDTRGRLSLVNGLNGRIHRYTYTGRDQLATMIEPGTDIENSYDADGRCVRQVNRYPDREPYVFDLTYVTNGKAVVETESRRSDGTWVRYAFDDLKYTISETWGLRAAAVSTVTYERDPATRVVTSLTLTCPDRRGIPLRHTSLVRRPGTEDQVTADLASTYCHSPREARDPR